MLSITKDNMNVLPYFELFYTIAFTEVLSSTEDYILAKKHKCVEPLFSIMPITTPLVVET
jgi:hypothetical protein